jgi:hypothetical protein
VQMNEEPCQLLRGLATGNDDTTFEITVLIQILFSEVAL